MTTSRSSPTSVVALKRQPGMDGPMFASGAAIDLLLRLEEGRVDMMVVSGQFMMRERRGSSLPTALRAEVAEHRKELARLVRYCERVP